MISAKKTRAFTLIELSVVLVIIGLIVGGVLVGQDLIEGAKMRKQMTTLEQLDTAVYTFQAKYDALPGDMKIADAIDFGLPYRALGAYVYHDGGGKLTQYNSTGCTAHPTYTDGMDMNCASAYLGEPQYFFIQLYAAGLSPYNVGTNANDLTTGAVKLDLGAGYIYPLSTPHGKNGYFLGMGATRTNNHFLDLNADGGSYTPYQALRLDTKFDDGVPDSGQIKAVKMWAGWGIFEDWGPHTANYTRNCVSGPNSALEYDTTTSPDTNECQVWVQAAW